MITITIIDRVNCSITGLTPKEHRKLQDHIKYREKGAHMTALFKLGEWDGYTSMVSDDGLFYLYHIERVADFLLNVLRKKDNQIDIVDNRPPSDVLSKVECVGENFLLEELGYPLREIQTNAINAVLENGMGVLELATNSGKSAICLALSKCFDPFIKTLICVPSNQLVNQTYEYYEKCPSISSAAILSKDSAKKRLEKIKNNRHIIMTNNLYQNMASEFVQEPYAIFLDEVHIFGEVMEQCVRTYGGHFPIRIGLTGTLTKEDKYKAERIKCNLGGDTLSVVAPKELIEKGYASIPKIRMVRVHHKEVNDLMFELMSSRELEWGAEQAYLTDNKDRTETIAKYLEDIILDKTTNTLVLCPAALGLHLGEYMGEYMITEKTPDTERSRLFSEFDSKQDAFQLASYGTSSTGISKDRIFRIVLIDVGKNRTRVLQSIGRGLRLDGVKDEVEVVDVYSDTPFSMRHKKERKSLYKKENFAILSEDQVLEVGF